MPTRTHANDTLAQSELQVLHVIEKLHGTEDTLMVSMVHGHLRGPARGNSNKRHGPISSDSP